MRVYDPSPCAPRGTTLDRLMNVAPFHHQTGRFQVTVQSRLPFEFAALIVGDMAVDGDGLSLNVAVHCTACIDGQASRRKDLFIDFTVGDAVVFEDDRTFDLYVSGKATSSSADGGDISYGQLG